MAIPMSGITSFLSSIREEYNLAAFYAQDNDVHPLDLRRNLEKRIADFVSTDRLDAFGELIELLNNYYNDSADSSMRALNLSEDPIRTAKYSLCCIATICASTAINSGLSENMAFCMRDAYIHYADTCTSADLISMLSCALIYDFAEHVSAEKVKEQHLYVKRSIQYVKQHLHEKISTQRLADLNGCTPNYLTGLFKKDLGISPVAYIRKRKLKYAAGVLVYSAMSISEISDLLSFSSVSHFSDYFRSEYGMTPYQYRQEFSVKETE